MAKRRSIWGSISTSKKVNSLSSQAVILYVFSIPHFDDEGYLEGDANYIKTQIVPFRNDISQRKVPKLIREIATVHKKVGSEVPLWVLHSVDGCTYIEDPYFKKKQTFHAMHPQKSEIKQILENFQSPKHGETDHQCSTEIGDESAPIVHQPTVPKRSEVKRSEFRKRDANVENFVEISNEPTQETQSQNLSSLSPPSKPETKPKAKPSPIEDPEFLILLQTDFPHVPFKLQYDRCLQIIHKHHADSSPWKQRDLILSIFRATERSLKLKEEPEGEPQ